jgi:hypothetical protein
VRLLAFEGTSKGFTVDGREGSNINVKEECGWSEEGMSEKQQ